VSYITDPDLGPVLVAADDYDLGILADYITDSGEGRISLSKESCSRLHGARTAGRFDAVGRALVAEELSRFGGNSLMNMWRGSGVGYDEIVRDVAEHLGVTAHARASCADIEQAIVLKMTEQSFKKMSDDQKSEFFHAFDVRYAGAVGAMGMLASIGATPAGMMNLTAVVANGTSTALLGRGLGATVGVLAGASGMRLAAVFLGAIGWAFTIIWTAFGLTSPAYRVTVPCVIHVAYMRLKMNAAACPQCRTAITPGARFCSSCGAPLAAPMRLVNES
jgi:uncharacterized protein YaaW (UPF0174 family)